MRPASVFSGAAFIAAGVGAVGSLWLMLHAGRNTPPLLLVAFFFWVLSPFVALGWANVVSTRWAAPARMTLYGLTLVVTLISLALYGNLVARPLGASAAVYFVIVPPGSLALVAISVAIAAFLSRRQAHRGGGPV